MHHLHADRPLPDRGRNPLHAARARVADAEHAGDGRLHEVGPARQRPVRRRSDPRVATRRRSSRISCRRGACSPPARRCSDRRRSSGTGCGSPASRARPVSTCRHCTRSRPLSPSSASIWLRVRSVDVRGALDALDQVARHALGEPGAAHQHVHARGDADRNTAACPAELPPPTIATSSPSQSWPSRWVAL